MDNESEGFTVSNGKRRQKLLQSCRLSLSRISLETFPGYDIAIAAHVVGVVNETFDIIEALFIPAHGSHELVIDEEFQAVGHNLFRSCYIFKELFKRLDKE